MRVQGLIRSEVEKEPSMSEIIFVVEEAPEGSYTAKAL